MSNIEKIRQEIERRKGYISVTHFAEELLAFIDSLPEETCKDSLQVQETCKENQNSFTDEPKELEEEIKNYFDGLWPGTETAEQCNTDLHFTPLAIMRLVSHFAEWQKKQDKDWLNCELMKAHLNGVMTGDRIARESLPMPEDTVIFQKDVAEGRRLEREDRNDDNLPRYYGD